VNFIGGLSGALTFSIPSTLVLPALLLVDGNDETLLIGAAFSVVGLAVTVAVWLLARRQYEERPRWVSKDNLSSN
jgi:ABC-type Fe3+ transport system permease subunit